ncbi:hypothetical protein Trco_000911 [Trichoderma cornu-damae]|uniref:Uncharacterized protein n=1 Tax=Trichoderma cornu-damae TaxID=654480 RepID=A0A9P8QT18_9HYPO|nr:hypothetical protein Trco_000911 [Trichoderma cornu-damae]
MSTLNDEKSYAPPGQGNEAAADMSTELALDPVDTASGHHAIAVVAPEPWPSENPPSPDSVSAQQQPLPSFDVAHQGWDASNVSTAKCDFCHNQRRGTLQKCRICKLSICRECCVNGRLHNDQRHTIDAAAVDWDAPPNSRKRKHRALEEAAADADERPTEPKRQRAGANPRRGRGRPVAKPSRGASASPAVDDIPSEEGTPAAESDMSERGPAPEYSYISPMEPRLSVAPSPYFPSISRAQHTDVVVVPPKCPDQHQRETASPSYRRLAAAAGLRSDESDRGRAPLESRVRPATSNSAVSPANGGSQAALPRLVPPPPPPPPPSELLDLDERGQRRPPGERFQTGPDTLGRLEHLLHHHRQSVPSETWPSHEHVSSLGVRLADAARTKLMSSSAPIPLDHCLRDAIQHEWGSRAFVGIDPDAGRRYRHLLAAAYFASACLGLPPQLNAARAWLCETEQSLRETGHEPTKSAPLMNFLQEIGVWYLRQAQR